MAPPSINTRITLTGLDEVLRHLKELAEAGERAGNRTRAALLGAMGGANDFSKGAKAATASVGQMRAGLVNLGQQVQDVVVSLQAGQNPMTIFLQQGSQIGTVFAQTPGVLGAAATAIRGMITPMTAAIGAAAGLAAGLGVLIARSVDTTTASKQFDAQLQGLGKNSRISGKELEEAAQRLKDIGLSTDEARKKLFAFNAAGGKGEQGERILRIGKDLERVFGEGTMDKFADAVAKGDGAVREFGVRLGLLPQQAADASAGMKTLSAATTAANAAIVAAITGRNQAIADEQRSAAQQIADLTRKKGTAEEEIAFQSARRIEAINKTSNDAINAQIAARNKAAQDSLAAFNKKIEDAAQAAATGGDSIVSQIETRVKGLDAKALGPVEETTRRLNATWGDFLNTLSQSAPVQTTINEFTHILGLFTNINAQLERMAKNRADFFAAGGGVPIATAPIPGLAGGGMVRGPGTGTSDSIIARVSAGEFVNTAAAVRRFGAGFFESLNRMAMPAMPRVRMPRGMAAGGLVAAGGGSVVLQFPSGATVGPMMADRQIFQAVQREARRAGARSAGKLPSTG